MGMEDKTKEIFKGLRMIIAHLKNLPPEEGKALLEDASAVVSGLILAIKG